MKFLEALDFEMLRKKFDHQFWVLKIAKVHNFPKQYPFILDVKILINFRTVYRKQQIILLSLFLTMSMNKKQGLETFSLKFVLKLYDKL